MAKKRIFLLPGFGEDLSTYDPLLPYLKDYEVHHVDYSSALSKVPLWNTSGYAVVRHLLKEYDIQPEDKLIGHSTGGYFVFLIREMQGNEIAMISGFSDCAKVVPPLPYPWITSPLVTILGITKTEFSRNYMLKKIKGKPVAKPTMDAMMQMTHFSSIDLYKIVLILTFDEKPFSILPNPLRIHAKDDKLVRLPDEPYQEVKGGHFPLALDIQGVVSALRDFL